MKFSDLKLELDGNLKRNLYIFTGPETEVMNRYIKRISPKPMRSDNLEGVLPKLRAKGLFATSTTYVIEDDKKAAEMSYDELLSATANNTLILVYKDIDKRKKLFKTGEEHIVVFEKFTEQQLVNHVQSVVDVDSKLAELIALYCGNDVARIDNEAHKLNFTNQPITEELVRDLIEAPLENRMFDMIDAIAKRRPEQAFKLYIDLVDLKVSPIQMISILYTKWKHLFLVQSYSNLQNKELAGKTGLTFFQVNLTRNLIGAFTLEDILYFMIKTQEAEVLIKTGKLDQYVCMEALLVDIFR